MLNGLIARATAASVYLVATGWFGTALAQNYDGNHQVRGGFFAQGAAVHGGATATIPGDPATETSGSYSFGSAGIGFTGGLEWIERGRWSWGVEIDGAALSGSGDAADFRFGTDYLATARVRGGVFVRPNTLWYGTIGFGFLGTQVKDPSVAGSSALKQHNVQTGIALGTGLEWDFGSGVVFAEYLMASFDDMEARLGSTPIAYDTTLHNFRVGMKFKLGHDYYVDDVARRIGK